MDVTPPWHQRDRCATFALAGSPVSGPVQVSFGSVIRQKTVKRATCARRVVRCVEHISFKSMVWDPTVFLGHAFVAFPIFERLALLGLNLTPLFSKGKVGGASMIQSGMAGCFCHLGQRDQPDRGGE